MRTLDTGRLGVLLKSRGVHMSRSRYQRPEVHLWTGKSKEKFWKAEWRVYIEGRPKPKHRAQTWPCALYTKAKAQEDCDRIVREETGGALRPDGSMTVSDFWEKVFYPTLSRRLAENSKASYESAYRTHIKPAIGAQELQHVTKHGVETLLGKIADANKGRSTLERVLILTQELFLEAVENGYLPKNPARKIQLPRCADHKETQALTEQQVRNLFENTLGRDRLMWRILVLTGCRIGELLALRKTDVIPVGLCIDESSRSGKPSSTKNGKTRYAPIPDSLRREIKEWAATVSGEILFPNAVGSMFSRASDVIRDLLDRGRAASGLPGFQFRQCRTTFATLYDGHPKDRQEILGHYSEAFTMRVYQRAIASRQQASVEELDARLSGKVVEMPRREETA